MPRPINFLFITTFYPPYHFGGDAIITYQLAHALANLGHSVDVIHCIDSYNLFHPGEPEDVFDEHPNVHRHGLVSGYGWLAPLLAQQTGKPLLKRSEINQVLERKPFDVIHYHNISLFGPDILAIIPSNERFVKVYTTHEHWLICPTHVLWKYGSRPCEKPDCLICTIRARRPPQLWRYTGLIKARCKHVDKFLSPSKFTADIHRERGFGCGIEIMPNFTEQRDMDWQEPSPRSHDNPYFLFVGRLEHIKGLHTLIDAWDRVQGFNLLVAGTGTDEIDLKKRAADNPRIRFLGRQTQAQLGNYYVHAIATIVPSVTYETFGLVIAESFARKTPVIVRNLGALPEPVIESGGGYVYSTDDELLSAIEQLGHSKNTRDTMGQKGYQTFTSKYTIEAVLNIYFDHLNDIAERKFGTIPWN